MEFLDRADAGHRLAAAVRHLTGARPVVLGLPRGGVVVAAVVARELRAPLDVALVRKLGVPYQPELAAGAVGEGGVRVMDEEVRRATGMSEADLSWVEARERAELARRARAYRVGRTPLAVRGRAVVIVDDGLATGSTARAACQVARAHGAARVILAVPVAPAESLRRMAAVTDEIVCLVSPEPFYAIGQWYRDFSQTSDEEVVRLLEEAGGRRPVAPAAAEPRPVDAAVQVDGGDVALAGHLHMGGAPLGVVLFAHGSGSGSHSPRHRRVAAVLREAGLGTLQFDLLTDEEAADPRPALDVGLLAGRLVAASAWLRQRVGETALPIGYFGAGTGATAALLAAVEGGGAVAAVVARGGRPDLAAPRLGTVKAPTLLIVGERDVEVLAVNRRALHQLRCDKRLAVVGGASHLFEEEDTLERTAVLGRDWFVRHFCDRVVRLFSPRLARPTMGIGPSPGEPPGRRAGGSE